MGRAILAAMPKEPREKTSFALQPRVKIALEKLKLRARQAGVARADATEAAIVEALILDADFDRLLDKLNR
jgi:hypothetical protein